MITLIRGRGHSLFYFIFSESYGTLHHFSLSFSLTLCLSLSLSQSFCLSLLYVSLSLSPLFLSLLPLPLSLSIYLSLSLSLSLSLLIFLSITLPSLQPNTYTRTHKNTIDPLDIDDGLYNFLSPQLISNADISRDSNGVVDKNSLRPHLNSLMPDKPEWFQKGYYPLSFNFLP